jgi:hypothetical protein
MGRRTDRWGLRAFVLAVIALGLLTAGSLAAAAPALQSGKYAVTVLDGGTAFPFTWTITVTGGAITGTSYSPDYGFNDPLSGSVQGTGATIVRSCGPEASARYTDCGSQTYVLQAGAGGVLSGTGTGFGVVPGTTITMQLTSAAALPDLPPADNPTGRMMSIKPVDGATTASVTVKRNGTLYSASQNSQLQTGDIIQTDAHTRALVEFLIGGRVGINVNTKVKMIGERSASAPIGVSLAATLKKNWDIWVTGASAKQMKAPIEIQTNGGTMGIRG